MFPTVKRLAFFYIFIVLIACNSDKKEDTKVVLKDSAQQKLLEKQQEIKDLTQNTCLYCHRIQEVAGEKELAPKMQVVVDVYKAQYPKKDDFIKAFVDYSVNPDPKKSLMQGAIDIYKPMPNSGIVKPDAEEIASYLYDYKF